jgi:hypothetical protein
MDQDTETMNELINKMEYLSEVEDTMPKLKVLVSKYVVSDKIYCEPFVNKCSEKFIDKIGTRHFQTAWEEHKNGNQFFKKMEWLDSLTNTIVYNKYH